MEKFGASWAGILCWSTSSSDHSQSSDKSYSFVQKSDGCVICIPGPQVIYFLSPFELQIFVFKLLGYMLQFMDNDETTEVLDKLPDGFLLSDTDYNSSFADKPAAHALDPTTITPTTKTTIKTDLFPSTPADLKFGNKAHDGQFSC